MGKIKEKKESPAPQGNSALGKVLSFVIAVIILLLETYCCES